MTQQEIIAKTSLPVRQQEPRAPGRDGVRGDPALDPWPCRTPTFLVLVPLGCLYPPWCRWPAGRRGGALRSKGWRTLSHPAIHASVWCIRRCASSTGLQPYSRGWLQQQREERPQRTRQRHLPVEVGRDTAPGQLPANWKRVRGQYGSEAVFGGSYGWSSAGRLHHAHALTHRHRSNAGGGCTQREGNFSRSASQFLLPHVASAPTHR